jgi:hypothetical protein
MIEKIVHEFKKEVDTVIKEWLHVQTILT